jgi:pantothenate kinase
MPGAASLEDLASRARGLCRPGRRAILGIAGPPGAGKSMLAQRLVDRLAAEAPPGGGAQPWVALVPMAGFHQADLQLERLGLRVRKGAPETVHALG